MLEILLLIWIAKFFAKNAKKFNLSSALWATIGVLSYILGEIAGVMIMLIVFPEDLENILMVYAFGLPFAAILVVTSYFIMKSMSKEKELTNVNILDDSI